MSANTTLRGPLGDALHANLRGRLSHFIVDETSPAIVVFSPAQRATDHSRSAGTSAAITSTIIGPMPLLDGRRPDVPLTIVAGDGARIGTGARGP